MIKENQRISSSNSVRKLIQAEINKRPEISGHPDCDMTNSKMHVYVTHKGVTFAHEYNNNKQNIWVPACTLPKQILDIPHSLSPSSALWLEQGKYGRHSGLRKYADLVDEDLIKLSPETREDVIRFLDVVS